MDIQGYTQKKQHAVTHEDRNSTHKWSIVTIQLDLKNLKIVPVLKIQERFFQTFPEFVIQLSGKISLKQILSTVYFL